MTRTFLASFTYLLRSVFLGLIFAAIILLLVPELRTGNNLLQSWLGKPDPREGRVSFYDALSRSAPAVVNIYTQGTINSVSRFGNRTFERNDLGSGVIMTDNGYLLTCYHVVENADNIYVFLQDGQRFEAEIVGHDRPSDLAVLKVNAENLPTIPQLENTDLRVGDTVMAIGNPLNLGQTVTHGIVSSPGRIGLWNYVDFIQTDAVLNKGNSGGALIDSNGYLVGITNASFLTSDSRRRVQSVDGINFAVPYEVAIKVMNSIITHGRVIRGQLGFDGNTEFNVQGILVTKVIPNGPAFNAGLRPDDIVLSIDGERIENASKTLEMIAETPPGTELELVVERDGNLLNLVAEVGAVEV